MFQHLGVKGLGALAHSLFRFLHKCPGPCQGRSWLDGCVIFDGHVRGLEPSDKYAECLADWRERELPEWERDFEVWDGKAALRHPPSPPTVGRKGRTTKEALKKLRVAAYKVAETEHKAEINIYTCLLGTGE